MRSCTVPKIFGFRKWFESRFHELCVNHDYAYSIKAGKLRSDKILSMQMHKRGYTTLGLLTFVILQSPFGWYNYYKGEK